MKTCIECGAPVLNDGTYVGQEIAVTGGIAFPTEHGYTCGICSWGRSDQPRTAEDYGKHMKAAHNLCDPEIDYHADPHRGCILR